MADGAMTAVRWRQRFRLLVVGTLIAALTPILPTSFLAATPASAADPQIVAAGDIACDPTNGNFNNGNGQNGACLQAQTASLIGQINPAAVLALGDNQYYCGGYQAFLQSYNHSWGNYLAKTYPSVGNHEYLTSGGTDCGQNAQGYFQYFANAAKVGSPGSGYYSFDVGSWHLIALNSNCGDAGGCSTTSPQGQWLAADLAASNAPCTAAFYHIPLWSSGGRAASNTQALVQMLYDAGADVLLTGHDHIYERFALQNPQGQADPMGLRNFVVGTGGANHTSLAQTAANSQVRNDTTYGVLKMTLHSGSYDWNFVPIAGSTFTDSGTTSCHNAGSGSNPPPAPTLGLSESDATDFVSGTTAYYRQGSSGAFTVTATSSGATSMQFPIVFGGDGLTDTSSPFTRTYTWGSSATANGSFSVTASNSNGSSSSQFTVKPDSSPPTTTIACGGGSCSPTFSNAVSVSLTANDGTGSGVQSTYYTLDGSDPTNSATRTPYTGPFTLTTTTTVRYTSTDNVGNTLAPQSQTVTISGGGGGGAITLRQQKTTSANTASLPVTLDSPSASGSALVATIGIAAGGSASISSVTDSTGATWTQGPVGFLSGANSRVEIWYRLGAPSITGITVTPSTAKGMAVTLSEWTGVATTIDTSAAGNLASATTISTPALTATNGADLVIGAVNYASTATSTLATTTFTSLNDFSYGSSVHGRAAYVVTAATGTYQTSWNLSALSGGSGGAILALRAAPSGGGGDTTPPTTTITCNGGSCAGSFTAPVSVALAATDTGGSGVASTYYTLDGTDPRTSGTRSLYSSPFTLSATAQVRYSSTDNAGNVEAPPSQTVTVAASTDTTPPSVPVLTLSTSDGTDFVNGTQVFYNPTASGGSFTVTAATSDPESAVAVQFPAIFGADAANVSSAPFTHAYTWSTGATAAGTFTVTAASAGGSSTAQFTVTRDAAAPGPSQIQCNSSACASSYSAPVTVSLSSGGDPAGGAGFRGIFYTLDGSDPTTSSTRTLYSGPFTRTYSTLVRFAAGDLVGNYETPQSQTITITNGVQLVQQRTASASAATLPVTMTSPTTAGNALVAVIAVGAGNTSSVGSVVDSTGATWTRGPVSVPSNTNRRVEIWYRLAAPSVTSLTVTLTKSKPLAASVSEWAGVGSAIDISATGGGSASTTAPMSPSLTTTNSRDVVIGAINYSVSATSTLVQNGFSGLADFDQSNKVHGRAAYLRTTATGTYDAVWTLSAAGGYASAALALRAA